MKLRVCAQVRSHLPRRDALDAAARLGFEARNDGVLAVEHEVPTIGRIEGEGPEKAVAARSPQLLRDPPEPRWW